MYNDKTAQVHTSCENCIFNSAFCSRSMGNNDFINIQIRKPLK